MVTTFKLSHVEATPNPNAFKFFTGEKMVEKGQLAFSDAEKAARLPLAAKLFEIGTVEAVLIAEDFVSVSGKPGTDWYNVRETVVAALEGYDKELGDQLAEEFAAAKAESDAGKNTSEIYAKVNELMDQYVRPALAGDGGGLELLGVEDKIVYIRYQGACGSCPTSTAGTMNAIESLLRDRVDPDLRVQPA